MNLILRTFPILGIVASLTCCVNNLQASPIDDLASPSQATRDAAAKILRATYTPPPRTNWDALIHSLKIGAPKLIIEKQLQSSNFVCSGGVGSGNTEEILYRLDDLWLLGCSYTNITSNVTNAGLAYVVLEARLRDVWIEPPTNFTGVWKTYQVSGQPSYEIHYTNGLREGFFTSFHTNGMKCVVSPQHNDVPDGEEIGYHPSGKIAYKGRYKAGQSVGKWIWYKEDGSIESEKDYNEK